MSFDTANDAIRYGIAKVHQEINMVPEMTVAQNIALGNEPKKFGIIDFKKLNINIHSDIACSSTSGIKNDVLNVHFLNVQNKPNEQ